MHQGAGITIAITIVFKFVQRFDLSKLDFGKRK